MSPLTRFLQQTPRRGEGDVERLHKYLLSEIELHSDSPDKSKVNREV